jgi:FtsP/CotA-like multicopper oxidase with cupredoxin domain
MGPCPRDHPGRRWPLALIRMLVIFMLLQVFAQAAPAGGFITGNVNDPAGSIAAPRLDTVELWRFTSDFHHPVHTHLVHFQVLSRGGAGRTDPAEGGWKDTVDVRRQV